MVGKTPGGRRLQPTENTCVAWRWLSPEDFTSQSRNKVQSVKKFELYSLTIYSKKKDFLTELSYQQLSDELPPIIYPKLTSWFRPCRNLHENQIFVFRCWPGEGEVDRKWVRMLVVPFRGQKKNQRPSWYVLGPFPLNKIPEISITKAILMIWLEPLEHIDHGIFIFGIFPFLAFELVLFRSRHQLLPLPHR